MFDVRYTNDIVLLIWMGIAFFLSKDATRKKVTILGQEEERYTLLFAVIVFYPLFWFVTTVFMRGDMYAYQDSYNDMTMTVGDVIQNWDSIGKGPGYSLLCAWSKSMGFNEFRQFRVVIALLQSAPLVLIYWKYSEDYVYSIYLFVATMSYDGWMMNGMRQFLAACLVFAAFPFLLKKKYVFTVLLLYAAVSVHKSAIMMIPVFILIHFKPWAKSTIFLMLVFMVVLYIYVRRSDWMDEETLQASRGSSPIRILINAIPVVIAFFGRKQIALANNRLINMCVNMSMVTVIVYIVASMTSGIMTGRLPGYTMLFNFLLYPYLLNKVFNETVSKNIRLLVTLFYVAFFIADLYFI